MENNEKDLVAKESSAVDIFSLGKRFLEEKILDPYDPTVFSIIRFSRMTKPEYTICVEIAQKAYLATKKKILGDPAIVEDFDNLVAGMKKEDIIARLLNDKKAVMVANRDLIDISEEEGKSKEDADAERDIFIENKIADEKLLLEAKDEVTLRANMKEFFIEDAALTAKWNAFSEAGVGMTCYRADKEERIFSHDPESERHVSKLRDPKVYESIMTAYRKFMKIMNMSPEEIRENTSRGSDFFTSTA